MVLLALLLWAALADLSTVPPLFWDEGWTLSVARHWVERGHYGQLADGQPRGPGLAASLPVVAPIAAAFRLLGVGVWQGRLPGALLALASLWLVCALTDRLHGRRAAWAALGALLLLTYPDPILVGRHALGEVPAVFHLVLGHLCLLRALDGSVGWVLPAALAWGVALQAKAQVWPFWLASLLLALAVAALMNWRRPAGCLVAGLVGGWLAERSIAWLYRAAVLDGAPEPPLAGLFDVTAVVLAPSARLAALSTLGQYGLPALAGLAHGAWRLGRELRGPAPAVSRVLGEVALLGLAGSWLAWFGLLAPAWVRYLFPPVFLAAPFVARLLADLTGSVVPGRHRVEPTGRGSVPRARPVWLATGLLAGAVVAIGATRGVTEHVLAHRSRAGEAVLATAAFLNQQVAPKAARVETYDSELMFLLRQPYHYPPDQVHVALNRRTFVDPGTPVVYDPLAADPDYLVTGPLPRMWRLYDAVVATPAFRNVARFGDYLVYERVRPAAERP